MPDKHFLTYVEHLLQEYAGNELLIKETKPIGGGSINIAVELVSTRRSYFIKYNESNLYRSMFSCEAKGLELLRSTNTFRIPNVIAVGDFEKISFLLLEFILPGKRKQDFFADMGNKLALLHRNSTSYFGLEYDNWIGTLSQLNTRATNGVDFFINNRLEYQIDLAMKNNILPSSIYDDLKIIYKQLNELLPSEAPALLHGDLWNGNYMHDENGSPCLIDPAVYYGSREADIAMTKLFGGFDNDFYDAYNESFPLQKNWEERIDLWNLYPLLVHLNLFGASYLLDIKSIVGKYV